MTNSSSSNEYHFWTVNRSTVMKALGKSRILASLQQMLLIRNFETRAEAAYQQGKVGGFFHAYIGQEAIQTAALAALGPNHWYITTYRCHALALLLGATPEEIMAELYGRANGNAKGRGGSMHLYTERLLGGFAIVGGQIPIATGAAFSLKYLGRKEEIAICFMGDGAVPQGAFHESLNMAAMWQLPCLYVIENNQWSMGTPLSRTISALPIAEKQAPSYGMEGYSVDGMDFFACYDAFVQLGEKVRATNKPILVEMKTERFRGHSISDPGLYRTKEHLAECLERDPIAFLKEVLIEQGWLTPDEFKEMDKEARSRVISAMEYADQSPWPDPLTIGEDVYAPNC